MVGVINPGRMNYVRIWLMDSTRSPSVISILPLALILAGPGWTALIYLLTTRAPTLGNRWLFYVLVILALSGTVMPGLVFVNKILQLKKPVSFETVIREAMMVGVYGAILLWLNKGQVLSTGLALVIALGMFTAELLIRLRKQSRWRPGD